MAFLGTAEERGYFRRRVDRSHAMVRSGPDSPIEYSAYDPRLQLWVAACLYRGTVDMHALIIRTLATVSRLLPAPVSRFPFNACLADLRLRRKLPARR